MPPTTVFTIGPSHEVLQNVIYAIPIRGTSAFIVGTGNITVEFSNDGVSFADPVTLAGGGEFTANGEFMRMTQPASASISFKAL